ncbi:MAG: hypothetical protein GTO55_11630 [Armatimonadetes bacterium]|nr:hypothetical protein [Armatimonadota bacterium]NIM24866.1 hypothetical protein [Armatimonadota bacterium]NIM68756.1 hypothetical protein [Armatimonadota bacterium]NIM77017.1 hypothetical protein [Armatimonadota bacterium]NIO98805.1 hypothetical protein [Armatimonadota bacterium]
MTRRGYLPDTYRCHLEPYGEIRVPLEASTVHNTERGQLWKSERKRDKIEQFSIVCR